MIETLFERCFRLVGCREKDPAAIDAVRHELALKRERLLLVKESLFTLDADDNVLDDSIIRYTATLGLCEKGGGHALSRSLLAQRIEQANPDDPHLFEALRAYLAIAPGDFRLLERLENHAAAGPDFRNRLAGLRERYACAYAYALQTPQMSYPNVLALFGQGGFAVVTGRAKNVLLLDAQGNHAGTLNVPLRSVHGVFASPEGTVWICDFGADLLYEIDRRGEVLRSVRSSAALGREAGEARAVTGCFHQGRIYLQVCGPSFETGQLAVLARSGGAWAGRVLEAPTVTKPGGIHSVADEVYFADRQRPSIFAWDPRQETARSVFRDPSLLLLNDFTVLDDSMILSTDRGLSKYTRNGTHIFSRSLQQEGSPLSIVMRMQATRAQPGHDGARTTVYLCDVGMNRVHVMRV